MTDAHPTTTDQVDVAMLPVKTEDCNFAFHLPGQPGEGVMPCIRELENVEGAEPRGTVTSFWKPEGGLPPARDGDDPVALHILVYGFQPQLEVGFGSLAEASFEVRDTQPHFDRKTYWCGVTVTEEIRAHLDDGGLFALRVHMCPPPPVCVWIA